MTTIAINNLTQLDYAAVFDSVPLLNSPYIFGTPRVIGGSFNVSVLLSGATSEEEQVVLDFGTAKKLIKALIDHKEIGLDHKLLLNAQQLNGDHSDIGYDNSCFLHEAPPDARHVVPFRLHPATLQSELSKYLSKWLTEKLAEMHDLAIKVTVQLDQNFVVPNLDENPPAVGTFRYTHGLPRSSSWGCRNLFHGHYSIVALYGHFPRYNDEAQGLAARITDWLNNCHLVERKHYDPHGASIGYGIAENGGRGYFSFKPIDFGANFIRVFEGATTIENLTDYVLSNFKSELQEIGVRRMYVSEGLTKGAVVVIPFLSDIEGDGSFTDASGV